MVSQAWLLPQLEDEIGELDDKHRQFVAVCEICALQEHMAGYRWVGNGCPPKDRLARCKAFIAKAETARVTSFGSPELAEHPGRRAKAGGACQILAFFVDGNAVDC